MKVVLSLEAAERLEAQIAYLRNAGADAAAEKLRDRVMNFIATVWHTSQDRAAPQS